MQAYNEEQSTTASYNTDDIMETGLQYGRRSKRNACNDYYPQYIKSEMPPPSSRGIDDDYIPPQPKGIKPSE